MKHIKTSQVIKMLNSNGYTASRQTGSHLTFKNASGITTTIVNQTLQSPGTLRNVSDETGIDFEARPQKVKGQANSLPFNFWDIVNELGLNPFQLTDEDKRLVMELC